MEVRYSWKEMPEYYHANFYNKIDLEKDRKFVIIDNVTKMEYSFPNYEMIRDKYGHKKQVTTIVLPLWNQEFFNWICRTAPDFCIDIPEEFLNYELLEICLSNTSHAEFIKQVPILTKVQYLKFVKRLPEAIMYVPKEYKTQEFLSILEENPELLIHFPKESTTPELCKKCYEKVSWNRKKDFVEMGYMDNLITSEMLEELIDNVESLGRSIIYGKIPKNIINVNIAWKLIEENSNSIIIIPEDILTYKMCEKSVMSNGYNISNVPKIFQTFEIHKMTINQGYRYLTQIPKDSLSDEIIIYALNINGLALGNIPQKRRTEYFCELAVKNNAKAIRHVPKNFRNYEMCKNVVLREPTLIKEVPLEILTRQFLNELYSIGVVIPDKCMEYVKKCLSVHDKIAETINYNSNTQVNQESKIENEAELKNISIASLENFFSTPALRYIEEAEIANLEQLFDIKMTFDLGNYRTSNELKNTIKLLRCKYLGEKPPIDINDTEINSVELYKLLGLSNRSSNCLEKGEFSENAKDFFEKMRNPLVEKELRKIRTLGNKGILEIIEKANIVINYYDNLEEKKKPSTECDSQNTNDELDSLIMEIKGLQEKRRIIEQQIDAKMAKIIEIEQGRGRVLR